MQLPRLQGEGNGERGGEVEEGRGEKDREEERGGKNKTKKQTEFRRTVMEHIMEHHKPDLNLEHNWNMEVLMEEQNILGKLT